MNVKEMHIEVNQSLQKIAANKTRKLFPEEVDWLLNKNQERFIDLHVTPRKDGSGGFEIDQHATDAVRKLIRTRAVMDCFNTDPKRAAIILPGDYRNLLSDASVLKKLCGSTATSSVLTKNLLVIPIRKSAGINGVYYANATVTINGNIEFNITDITQSYDGSYIGYNSPEQIYEIINIMIWTLKGKGFEVYWEEYGDRYYPKSLVVVSAGALSGSVTLDGVTRNGTVLQQSFALKDVTGKISKEVDNTLTPTHKISTLNSTAFFKTMAEGPISELAGTYLYAYTDETFIVTNMVISYVRKPRRISIILGQDCELAPESHQKICDLTVEYIKAMIADPTWEAKLRDNIARTTL
jgi:hypothetical protein